MPSFHYHASVISRFPADCPRRAPQSKFNSEQQDKNIRDMYKQLEQELLYRERRQWVSECRGIQTTSEHSSRDSGAGAVNRLMDGWESFPEQLLSIKPHKYPSGDESTCSHTATQRTIWTVQITDMMIKWVSEWERDRIFWGLIRKASELLLWLILHHFY